MEKLSWWLYDYIIYEEFQEFNYDELPFEVDENEDIDIVCNKLEDYINNTLGYELVKTKLIRCSIEDRFYDTEYVIKLNGKYYKFEIRYDDWNGYDYPEDIDVWEVKPVSKYITEYEAV